MKIIQELGQKMAIIRERQPQIKNKDTTDSENDVGIIIHQIVFKP